MIRFEVPGRPIPYSRPALYQGRKITPAKERNYRKKVGWCARAAALGSTYYAKERLRVSIVAATDARADLDNIAKSINDALNGVLWNDDRQIDVLVITRVHTTNKKEMNAVVEVEPINVP